jgi:hypothetical protein
MDQEPIHLTRTEAMELAAVLTEASTTLEATQYLAASVETRDWADLLEVRLFGEEGGNEGD